MLPTLQAGLHRRAELLGRTLEGMLRPGEHSGGQLWLKVSSRVGIEGGHPLRLSGRLPRTADRCGADVSFARASEQHELLLQREGKG